MNTMPKGIAEFIGATENEAVARFYDRVKLGNMYRNANTAQALKQVIAKFLQQGYEIVRIPMPDMSENESRYQLLLMHNAVGIASQDISISAEIGDIVVYDDSEVADE